MTRASVIVLLTVSGLPTVCGLAGALWYGSDSGSFQRVLDAPGVGWSLASSVWTGVLATVLSLLLAHLAVAVAVSGRWHARLNAFALPFLAMPHLALGIGLALVLAPSGLLLRLISPGLTGLTQPPDWFTVQDPHGISLVLGLVIKEMAFLVLVLFAARAQVPVDRLMLQARSLGYGRLKGWFIAVAPLLQEQIRLPLIAVLVFGITNVEMAIPLGPGLPPTFSVMVWQWYTDPDPAVHAQAYSGSLLLLAVAAISLAGLAALAHLARALWRGCAQRGARRVREKTARRSIVVLLGMFWTLGALSLVAILLRSAGGMWRFPDLLPTAAEPMGGLSALLKADTVLETTFLLGIATALAAVVLVLPAAERLHRSADARQWVGALLFVPLMLPQMTFLLGVQVFLTGLRIDGTFMAVLWSHLIFALPYVWGMLAHARAAIDPRYHTTARTLGASRGRAWFAITAPMLLRSGVLAFALAFSVSVALYLPTLFAGAGRVATAATEAAAAAASGSLAPAAVQAVILATLPLLAFALAYAGHALVYRHRRGVPG